MLMLTIQVNETNRDTWEIRPTDVAELRASGTGTDVRLNDGTTKWVLEAISDMQLQCDALGVPLPPVAP